MEWSGEFEEMQAAVERLAAVASLALVLILVLLYLALQSLLDVLTVFSNVVVICVGGIWSLFATGTNFNISAGVGFISILGVGIMNGLIVVSAMNSARHRGLPVLDAIRDGMQRLHPSPRDDGSRRDPGHDSGALATKVGSQSQKPLAIVVVGGMAMTLLFLNLIPVLYSLYGKRQPPMVAGMEH